VFVDFLRRVVDVLRRVVDVLRRVRGCVSQHVVQLSHSTSYSTVYIVLAFEVTVMQVINKLVFT
jgi:hypothetical protein